MIPWDWFLAGLLKRIGGKNPVPMQIFSLSGITVTEVISCRCSLRAMWETESFCVLFLHDSSLFHVSGHQRKYSGPFPFCILLDISWSGTRFFTDLKTLLFVGYQPIMCLSWSYVVLKFREAVISVYISLVSQINILNLLAYRRQKSGSNCLCVGGTDLIGTYNGSDRWCSLFIKNFGTMMLHGS